MTVPVVAAALLFWACVFMVYFTSASTTPLEFFLGRYAPPPAQLGVWQADGVDPGDGALREMRYLLPESNRKASYLLKQVRYRDAATREITRVAPEERVPRRRVSSR